MTLAENPLGTVQPAERMMSAMAPPLRRACAVRLIDRHTGQTHRINGRPLVLFTKAPEDAAAELLAGRDARVWDVRIEPIGADIARTGECA